LYSSSNRSYSSFVKEVTIGWTCDLENVNKICIQSNDGKGLERWLLGRFKRRWEDKLKMDYREIRCESAN
jgi:hypothetical protein